MRDNFKARINTGRSLTFKVGVIIYRTLKTLSYKHCFYIISINVVAMKPQRPVTVSLLKSSTSLQHKTTSVFVCAALIFKRFKGMWVVLGQLMSQQIQEQTLANGTSCLCRNKDPLLALSRVSVWAPTINVKDRRVHKLLSSFHIKDFEEMCLWSVSTLILLKQGNHKFESCVWQHLLWHFLDSARQLLTHKHMPANQLINQHTPSKNSVPTSETLLFSVSIINPTSLPCHLSSPQPNHFSFLFKIIQSSLFWHLTAVIIHYIINNK